MTKVITYQFIICTRVVLAFYKQAVRIFNGKTDFATIGAVLSDGLGTEWKEGSGLMRITL